MDRLCSVLIDNACRYAGDGGTVSVTVGASGKVVSLSVEDSGPGIPPEQRPFLFDRFRRGGDEGEGAGLGLAMADEQYVGGRRRRRRTPPSSPPRWNLSKRNGRCSGGFPARCLRPRG